MDKFKSSTYTEGKKDCASVKTQTCTASMQDVLQEFKRRKYFRFKVQDDEDKQSLRDVKYRTWVDNMEKLRIKQQKEEKKIMTSDDVKIERHLLTYIKTNNFDTEFHTTCKPEVLENCLMDHFKHVFKSEIQRQSLRKFQTFFQMKESWLYKDPPKFKIDRGVDMGMNITKINQQITENYSDP